MYVDYWKLNSKPFENTPDPRFLYRSAQHEEGLLRMLYAVREAKGAVMMTGVFGCGKTLLGRALMRELGKDVYKVVCINNPLVSHVEFLMFIATGLGVTGLPTRKTEVLTNMVLDNIGRALYNNWQDGKRTVVIVDESHIITEYEILEELRLLLNYQLEDMFLLTLILLGQPELKENIKNNKQLSQRISIRCHLGNLSRQETSEYILHRLGVAGRTSPVFTDDALSKIFEKTGGIPRRINQVCDLCLFTGFGQKLGEIDADIVDEAAADLEE